METRLCANCFAELQEGAVCPVCGWDNAKLQQRGALSLFTVLASRYIVGRAKSINGEGLTYAALDRSSQQVVELREFFPISLCTRREDGSVNPLAERQAAFAENLQSFIELSRNVSRLREVSVVTSVLDIFEDNDTAYTVYAYEPALSLRRTVENNRGGLDWNRVNRMFAPALSALGLMNSLGISHLGLSPETLRVRKDGTMLITGFCVRGARTTGGWIEPDLFPGCAAMEQYRENAACGEASDVYGFAACMLYALTGSLPREATQRQRDPKLLISREVLQSLPPFAVTAIANALLVDPAGRTPSFERFKSELSAAPTLHSEIAETEAIRRLPDERQEPRGRGVPVGVWLLVSLLLTLGVLGYVANRWLGEQGMSFRDLGRLFEETGSQETVLVVPNLANQRLDEWERKVGAGDYDFILEVSDHMFSETVEEGRIISQDPFPEETILPGDTVLVTVSRGSRKRTLPPIRGMSYGELSALLEEKGLVPQREDEYSDDVEAGEILRYEGRLPGEELDYGDSVTVVVSAGPEE